MATAHKRVEFSILKRRVSYGDAIFFALVLAGAASIVLTSAAIVVVLSDQAWVLVVTVTASIPVAIGTAIWIEEFAPRNRLITIVKINLANLAGVPSIIYGILGLAIFVRFYGWGRASWREG